MSLGFLCLGLAVATILQVGAYARAQREPTLPELINVCIACTGVGTLFVAALCSESVGPIYSPVVIAVYGLCTSGILAYVCAMVFKKHHNFSKSTLALAFWGFEATMLTTGLLSSHATQARVNINPLTLSMWFSTAVLVGKGFEVLKSRPTPHCYLVVTLAVVCCLAGCTGGVGLIAAFFPIVSDNTLFSLSPCDYQLSKVLGLASGACFASFWMILAFVFYTSKVASKRKYYSIPFVLSIVAFNISVILAFLAPHRLQEGKPDALKTGQAFIAISLLLACTVLMLGSVPLAIQYANEEPNPLPGDPEADQGKKLAWFKTVFAKAACLLVFGAITPTALPSSSFNVCSVADIGLNITTTGLAVVLLLTAISADCIGYGLAFLFKSDRSLLQHYQSFMFRWAVVVLIFFVTLLCSGYLWTTPGEPAPASIPEWAITPIVFVYLVILGLLVGVESQHKAYLLYTLDNNLVTANEELMAEKREMTERQKLLLIEKDQLRNLVSELRSARTEIYQKLRDSQHHSELLIMRVNRNTAERREREADIFALEERVRVLTTELQTKRPRKIVDKIAWDTMDILIEQGEKVDGHRFGPSRKAELPGYGNVHIKIWDGADKLSQSRGYYQEITVLATISHPLVVELLAVSSANEDTATKALVYPFHAKGNLQTFIEDDSFSAQSRLQVSLDICKAVVYIASVQLLHRDIKPFNVQVTDAFHGKLSNFTNSRFCPELVLGTEFVDFKEGTPGYYSPELQSKGLHNSSTDIYAMGITFMQVLSGIARPCREDSDGEVEHIRDLDFEDYPFQWMSALEADSSELRMGLNSWCTLAHACCSENPAERPTGEQVAQTLETIMSATLAPPKTCVVCLDEPREVRLSCGHRIMCTSCARMVAERDMLCPLCRERIDPNSIAEDPFESTFM